MLMHAHDGAVDHLRLAVQAWSVAGDRAVARCDPRQGRCSSTLDPSLMWDWQWRTVEADHKYKRAEHPLDRAYSLSRKTTAVTIEFLQSDFPAAHESSN